MGTHAGERENYVRSFTMVEQAALRRQAEATIEALLDLLNELDGPDNDDEPGTWPEAEWVRASDALPDENCEANGDELDASAPEGWRAVRLACLHEDAEEDDAPEDDDPRENTSLETYGMGFVRSGPDDAEDTHDAEWDTSDYEPSLGWCAHERGISYNGTDDLEAGWL
ncbi:hypothetical protein MWN34_08195 [Ancylobacter sp. 6x-1]|uniref:Uncharacterized protein n=1 Tax=Ancylobacter crimeensis TaxID=2579147 RepID=A0ABT0DAA8_9HYPH|nr:hypothetical protein [Ancylobacter crimeensis]MCK0196893.1 hypothetical protein [Ancylobacter crimeensis]